MVACSIMGPRINDGPIRRRRGPATSGVLMKPIPLIVLSLTCCALGVCAGQQSTTSQPVTKPPATTPEAETKGDAPLKLGNFSVSLTVKDLAVSRAFYEKLGFRVVSGNAKTWAVMQNETTKIGLFQGMFEK